MREARSGGCDPQRPVIFIGHSFGGLVLKEVLNLLLADSSRTDFLDVRSIIHIFFLGVVHDSDASDFETRWRQIVQVSLGDDTLGGVNVPASMKIIRRITQNFQEACGISSCTIAEVNPTELTASQGVQKAILVSPLSAQIRGGTVYAVPKAHLELANCANSRDEEYFLMCRELKLHITKHASAVAGAKEKQACLDSLTRPGETPDGNFNSIPSAGDGMSQWWLKNTNFLEWLQGLDSISVISGSPGCGKSVLAKYVAETLPQILGDNSLVVLKYAFNFSSSGSSTESMLRNLLFQLLTNFPSQLEDAVGQYRIHGHKFSRTSSIMLETFTEVIQKLKENRIVCILDAVDECRNVSGVLSELEVFSILRRLADLPNFKALVTSRTENSQINHRFIVPHISMEEKDVYLFVQKILQAQQHQLGWDRCTTQNLTKAITDRANGKFIFARLLCGHAFRQFANCQSLVETEKSIYAIDTLDSMYHREYLYIQSCSEINQFLVKQLFGLLLVARSRITFKFILEWFDTGTPLVNATEWPALEQDIYSQVLTPAELEYTLKAMYPLVSINNDEVTFTHHSIFEFLHHKSLDLSGLDPVEESMTMTWRCVSALEQYFSFSSSKGKDPLLVEPILDGTSFISYSVRNWMAHFRECEDQANMVLKNKAFSLFSCEEPLSQWATSYEELSSERIPHPGKLGPLLSGACFGLLWVAENSLSVENSIDDEDEHGRTAIHWASERGHSAIVSMLINRGGDVNRQDSGQTTPLHLAVRRGHLDVVQLLIHRGANPNLQKFDGETALHIAIEAENYDIAQCLIKGGADVLLVAYNGPSIVKIASQSSRMSALFSQLSMNNETKAAVIEHLVSRGSVEALASVLEFRPDIVDEMFPWTTELLEEGHTPEVVSDWLLKSENLHWVQDASYFGGFGRDRSLGADLQHYPGCAHNIVKHSAATSVPEAEDSPIGSEYFSSSMSINETSELELHFSELERREQAMVAICGFGGVFPPTANVDLNPGFIILRSGMASVIFGAEEKITPFLPLDTPDQVKRIQNAPPLVDAKAQDQAVSEEIGPESSEDFLLMDGESISSYNSTLKPSNYEIWDQEHAIMVIEALQNLLLAIQTLNNLKGCCDSFSILAYSKPAIARVSVCHYSELEELVTELKQYSKAADQRDVGWTQRLVRICEKILTCWQWEKFAKDYLNSSLGHSVCSVAIVTYTRGHSREFTHDSLSRSVDTFKLLGSNLNGPFVIATRVDLGCLGEMLQRPVWVFYTSDRQGIDVTQKFSLSTRIEDLLDLWGGSITSAFQVQQQTPKISIQIGGGNISLVSKQRSENDFLCHWTSDDDFETEADFFSVNDSLLVGVTLENQQCNLTSPICYEHLESSLFFMGTKPPQWKLRGQNFGVTAGAKGASASYTVALVKEDGKSRKKRILEHWEKNHSLFVLNEPVGLEVSICTGIARRVPLRRLFHGAVLQHLSQKVDDWSKVTNILGDLAMIGSNKEFDEFWKTVLSPDQKDVLEAATEVLLFAMEHTGVDKDANLVLWWPETDIGEPRAIRLDKTIYTGTKTWISMIEDSESCAVFGLLSTRCLEHDKLRKCRNPHGNSAGQLLEKLVLDTSLSPVNTSKTIRPVTITYDLHKRLELWQQRQILRVTQAAGDNGHAVRLEYGAKTPSYVRKMLKYDVVREQQALGDSQQNVVIL